MRPRITALLLPALVFVLCPWCPGQDSIQLVDGRFVTDKRMTRNAGDG